MALDEGEVYIAARRAAAREIFVQAVVHQMMAGLRRQIEELRSTNTADRELVIEAAEEFIEYLARFK